MSVEDFGLDSKTEGSSVEAEKPRKSRIWMIMLIPIFIALVVTGVKIYNANVKNAYCANAKAFTTQTNVFLSNKKNLPIATVAAGVKQIESLLDSFTNSAPSNYQSQAATFNQGMKAFFNAGEKLYALRKTSKQAIQLSKLPASENPIQQVLILDGKLKTPKMQDFTKNLLASCKINLGVLS